MEPHILRYSYLHHSGTISSSSPRLSHAHRLRVNKSGCFYLPTCEILEVFALVQRSRCSTYQDRLGLLETKYTLSQSFISACAKADLAAQTLYACAPLHRITLVRATRARVLGTRQPRCAIGRRSRWFCAEVQIGTPLPASYHPHLFPYRPSSATQL